jgi:trehalose synthase
MSTHVHEVPVAPLSPLRFQQVLDEREWKSMEALLAEAAVLLANRVVWNVNSTAAGGGVAEMLRSLIAYARGTGIDVRWAVISGNPDFYKVTKRIHNFIHGDPGDGGELGEAEHAIYRAVTDRNAEYLAAVIRPEDAVILHDPQTAGLVPRLIETGAAVVWRSHIGAEHPNDYVHQGWSFLEPFVREANVCVFSRHAYVPEWAQAVRTDIIQPSIDAFSPKNQEMTEATKRAILAHVGLAVGEVPAGALPKFIREDDTPGRVDRMCEVISTGPPPGFEDPLVTQVSRWDRLKDPRGVMEGFARHVVDGSHAHLIIAGPAVDAVTDDPEGAEVLDEVEREWRALPHVSRSRIHLACLPMQDIGENAAIVNALQRHSTIVVQKSLQEGFGLTVSEAMWKSRPVVASGVGGIRDQIIDGETGVLLQDPSDLAAFGQATLALLRDPERAAELGKRAHDHVRQNFLVNRHAAQYVDLLKSVLS